MVDRRTKQALIVATITLLLDWLFHYFYSSPQETANYFGIKFVVVFLIADYLFKDYTTKKAYIASLVFAITFSIYYRIVEVVQFKGYLSRVPDVMIGSLTITSAKPLLSALIWIVVHGGSFWLGTKIAGGIK